MNFERRQSVLKIVLPSLLVAMIYILFWGIPASKEVKASAQQQQQASQEVPPAHQLAEQIQKEKKLTDEQTRLRLELNLGKARFEHLLSQHSAAQQIEKVTQIFSRYNLRLLHESPEPAQMGLTNPTGFQKAMGNLQIVKPKLHSLDFYGRYLDLLSYLKELQTLDPQVIPLHIKVTRPYPESSVLQWKLVLWI